MSGISAASVINDTFYFFRNKFAYIFSSALLMIFIQLILSHFFLKQAALPQESFFDYLLNYHMKNQLTDETSSLPWSFDFIDLFIELLFIALIMQTAFGLPAHIARPNFIDLLYSSLSASLRIVVISIKIFFLITPILFVTVILLLLLSYITVLVLPNAIAVLLLMFAILFCMFALLFMPELMATLLFQTPNQSLKITLKQSYKVCYRQPQITLFPGIMLIFISILSSICLNYQQILMKFDKYFLSTIFIMLVEKALLTLITLYFCRLSMIIKQQDSS